jgi:hypothetical protein
VARIALGQLNTTVGDLDGNVVRMATWAAKATAGGADVIVFPELAVTGYPPEDLVLRSAFVDDNLTALDALAAETAAGCDVVVGFVDRILRRSAEHDVRLLALGDRRDGHLHLREHGRGVVGRFLDVVAARPRLRDARRFHQKGRRAELVHGKEARPWRGALHCERGFKLELVRWIWSDVTQM